MKSERWTTNIPSLIILLIFFLTGLFPPEIHPSSRAFISLLALALGLCVARDLQPSFEKDHALPALILLLFLFINCSLSFSRCSSAGTIGIYLTFFVIFLIFRETLSSTHVWNFLIWLTILASMLALYGIYQYFIGLRELADFLRDQGSTLPGIYLKKAESGRIFSTFPLPAAFAGYLLMTIPLCCFLIVSSKGMKFRFLCGIFLVLQVFALVLTFSLGALTAFFLSLLAFVLLNSRRRFLFSAAFLLAFSLAVFFFLSYRGISFSGLFEPGSPLLLRWGNWKASLLMILHHPLFGIGNGSFGIAFSQYREAWMNETHFAHNSFLQIIAENGAYAVPFLLFFLSLFMRNISDAGTRGRVGPFISFSCLTFLIHNFFDFTFYLESVSLLFFALCGLLFRKGADSRKPEVTASPTAGRIFPVLSKSILVILLILACIFEFSAYVSDLYFERAQNLRAAGRYGKADGYLKKAELLDPFKSEYRIYRAQLLSDRGNPEPDLKNALEDARMAVSLDPFIPYYHGVLSDIYVLQKNPVRAYEAIARARELYPADEDYRKKQEMLWKILQKHE